MLRLCNAANLPEAHLLLHRLAQAGIEARVLNKQAPNGLGEIPFPPAYPEIWIMEPEQEARAREILAEFERVPVSSAPARCAGCGETNPPGFEICWQCGRPLPASGNDTKDG
jgi:hypothetical protein